MIDTRLIVTLLIVIVPCALLAIPVSMALYHWKLKTKHRVEQLQKQQDAIQEEQELTKTAIVAPGNVVLERLSQRYNVIFWGGLGSGKTLCANVLTKYIRDKQEMYDWQNRRMLRYTNPGYMEKLEQLAQACKMPVYSEIELEDIFVGTTSMELWAYLTQEKRTMENGIYFIDEIGTKLGKDQYFLQGKDISPEYAAAADSARFARQDANIRFIGTEQDENNIWKPIRDKGFASVHMLGTTTWIDTKGSKKKWWKDTWLNILPAIFTLKVGNILACELGVANKVKAFLKCLLPAYFLQPKHYYIKRIEIAKKIKFEYTRFKSKLEFEGQMYYLMFTNYDIYKYNTRGHRAIYEAKFDKDGNRRHVDMGQIKTENTSSQAESAGAQRA